MNSPRSAIDAFNSEETRQPESLPEITANRIRTMITNGKLAPGTQLPNEFELAEVMKVSRGTIRSALSLLQQQGLVWRRQGVGSFVSEAPILENRLDIHLGVTDLIRSMGRKPGVKILNVKELHADENLSQKLNVPIGSPLVSVRRLRTADDKVVIAAIELFSLALLSRGLRTLSVEELNGILQTEFSLYRIFEDYVGITIDYGIARLKPMKLTASALKQAGFELPADSVVLYLEQVDYDRNREPVMFFMEYHLADFCEFTVYRRR